MPMIGIFAGSIRTKGIFSLPTNVVGDEFATQVVRTGYSGPIFNIRRSSDSVTADIYDVGGGTAYQLADGTSYTQWLGTDTAYVAVWYNQGRTGNDGRQTTLASQPVFSLTKSSVDTRTSRFLGLSTGIQRAAYTLVAKHQNSDSATGCMVGSGPYATKSAAALYRYTTTTYLHVWWNVDLGGGTWTAGNSAVAAYDGTTRFLYVNGKLVSSGAITPQSGSGNPVTIGTGGTSQHFNGDLQRVFLYNSCLTVAQIGQISI